MDNNQDRANRLAALCRRMGSLWSEKIIKTVKEEIPVAKLKECRLTLLGKLYSRPNVNFQAFQSTMKRAWKVEEVSCEALQSGLFSFTFRSEVDKQKVLNASPWSFSNNLLILKQLNPHIPVHCHNFTHCAFWVHVHGLPLARITESIMTEIVSSIGDILELKIATKEGNPCKIGKARVSLKLAESLLPGMLINFEEEQVWIDFKYERLPHYCYSCGRIGHYASDCKEFPYVEADFEVTIPGSFGYWLRVEERENSPMWKLFYGIDKVDQADEETVPETPPQPTVDKSTFDPPPALALMAGPPLIDKGKAKADYSSRNLSGQGTQLMLTDSPWSETKTQQKSAFSTTPGKIHKSSTSKKKRRHTPYGVSGTNSGNYDESLYWMLLSSFWMVILLGLWWLALKSHQGIHENTMLELSGAGQSPDIPGTASSCSSRKAFYGFYHGD